MTNEDVQDPLNEVGVHFCLVSKQAAVNLLPVEHYRPNAVVLFVSHECRLRPVIFRRPCINLSGAQDQHHFACRRLGFGGCS